MLHSRFVSQGLAGSDLGTPTEVAGRLLAVQAQDLRGARLAIRPRLSEAASGLTVADIDAALDDRSLVVGWLNRGTLHLVRSEDYSWLHAITRIRQINPNQVRLREEGVSEVDSDRGVDLIRDRLADGPATREELRDLVSGAGITVAGQALYHLLVLASIRGLILRGPMIGRDQAFVLVEDWLGEQKKVDPEAALPELARRFLAGHGPATDRDLAKWAGITLGQARTGLNAIAPELEQEDELVWLRSAAAGGHLDKAENLPVRLLGSFDPILHGWTSREWIIPRESDRAVVTTNGIYRPTLLAGARIVATWEFAGNKVEVTPFGKLDSRTSNDLEAETEDVNRFLAG